MTITFCGHSKANFSQEEKQTLKSFLEEKIKNCGADTFYLGHIGDFDMLCFSTLKELQKQYSHIKLVFITPYLYENYTPLKPAKALYDEIIFPPLETVLKKYCISKRNEWMVDNSDLLIAYVNVSWGGAAKMLEYAIKKNKSCINIANLK